MALLHGFLGRLHFGEAQIVYQNSDGAELENQHNCGGDVNRRIERGI